MAHKTNVLLVVATGLVLITLAGVRGQENAPQTRAEESADRLRQVVQAAARDHEEYCNQFLTAAIRQYLDGGETYAQGGRIKKLYSNIDLDGMTANEQIDYMNVNWSKVDLHEAMRLASEGQLVVAGLKGEAGRHGHVAVVMPGGPDPRTHWPVVAGGGAAAARSIEGKSMTQVWRRGFLHPRLQVEFFTPRFTPQTVTVEVKAHPSEQPKAKEASRFAYKKEAAKQVGSLEGTKWINSQGAEIEFRRENGMDQYHIEEFITYGGEHATANSRLLGLPVYYKNRPDGGANWMGLWNQVGNKLYLYGELVSGRLEHTATGTIQGDKILFEPHRYSDGSVSDPETWTSKEEGKKEH
jgi:hypothetical protein